jgi:hypothetical protein
VTRQVRYTSDPPPRRRLRPTWLPLFPLTFLIVGTGLALNWDILTEWLIILAASVLTSVALCWLFVAAMRENEESRWEDADPSGSRDDDTHLVTVADPRPSITMLDLDTDQERTFEADDDNVIRLPPGRFAPLGPVPGGARIEGAR